MTVEPNSAMTNLEFILWRGFVLPGHEACRLFSQNASWHIEGTAVFVHESAPVRLSYQIVCDSAWRTVSAQIEGWLGNRTIGIHIKSDPARRWWMNGSEQPVVEGCIDLDLNFSPSTNLLPIRRLGLAVGEAADINAAWLRFPSFRLEPLPQRYSRLEENIYRYESAGGQFVADLNVNRASFVLDYSGLWQAEATSA